MTLRDDWESYAKEAYPDGMGPEQKRQLYNTFFAGALSALSLVGQENTPEKGIEALRTVLEELKAWEPL